MTDKTQALLPVTHELLPCPFCGGPAELRQDVNYQTGEPLNAAWFAICSPCDLIRDQAWSVPRDTAIEQWNTRAALTPSPCPGDGMREALENACDFIEGLIDAMDYVGTGSGAVAVLEEKDDRATLARLRAALTPSATMEGVMRAAALSSSEHRYDASALSGDAGEEIGRLASRILELAPSAGLFVGIDIKPAQGAGEP